MAAVTAIRESAAIEAAPEVIEFVCTNYPQLRVTLTQIPVGRDARKILVHKVIQFQPRRVGTDERTNNPQFHGFYTPQSTEELAALRYEAARGYAPVSEVDVEERAAYDTLRRLQTRQNNMVNAQPGASTVGR